MTDTTEAAAEAAATEKARLWAEADDAPTTTPDTAAPPAPSTEAADEGGDPTAEAPTSQPPSTEGRSDSAEDAVDWSTAPEPLRMDFERQKEAHRQEIARHARRQQLLEQRLREAAARPPEQAAPATAGAADSDESESESESDFPEIAEMLKRKIEPLQAQLQRLTADQQRQAQAVLDENEAKVAASLPADFVAKHGKQFDEWVQTAATVADYRTYEQNVGGFVDPDGAIRVVQNFLRTIEGGSPPPAPAGKPQSDRRQRQLAAASSPAISSRPAASGLPRDGDRAMLWKMTEV